MRTLSTAAALLTAFAAVVASAPASAQQTGHIKVGGRDRSYVIDLPPAYDATRRWPLVLNFHGGGGRPEGARTQTGFSTLAARVGAIVVYPAGTSGFGGDRLLTWNTGSCCGYAKRANVDDVAFIRALLDTLGAKYAIDPKRVYATGLSNGGMMSYLVACRLADRVAAIAVVSGELSMDCAPSRPVSVLIIHGTADENLPYNGGVGPKALDKHDVRPVMYAVDAWRRFDKCTGSAATHDEDSYTRATSGSCADSTTVELYTIKGGGHAWPGGQRMSRILDAPSNALNATEVAWAFFAAHARE